MISLIRRNKNSFLIMSLFINPYLNLLLFSFGFRGEERREIVIFLSILFLILNIVYISLIFFIKKSLRKVILINNIAFILTLIPFILNSAFNFNLFVSHIVYVYPILVFVWSFCFVDNETDININIYWVLIPIIPVLFYYSFRGQFIGQIDFNLIDLDDISYMIIGNFMALILVIVDFSYNTIISPKYSNWIKYSLTFLLVFSLIVSGSKGAILSILTYSVFVLFSNRRSRDRKRFILIVQIVLAFIITFSLSSNNSGVQRVQNFLTETVDKIDKNVTEIVNDYTNVEPDEVENIEELTNSEKFSDEILIYLYKNGSFYKSIEILNKNSKYKTEIIKIRNDSISARLYLYKLSILEIKNNLTIGIGLFGFYNKYGTYPHNFILEILVDFGLIIGIAYLLLIFVIMKKLYDKINIDRKSLLIFSLVISYFPIMLFSNSLYFNYFLYLLLFYTLNMHLLSRYRVKSL